MGDISCIQMSGEDMKAEYKLYYRYLGQNIALYRKYRGMTQGALAERIGIDQSHMSRIENAGVGVSMDLFFTIAEALQVPPEKLLENKI